MEITSGVHIFIYILWEWEYGDSNLLSNLTPIFFSYVYIENCFQDTLKSCGCIDGWETNYLVARDIYSLYQSVPYMKHALSTPIKSVHAPSNTYKFQVLTIANLFNEFVMTDWIYVHILGYK